MSNLILFTDLEPGTLVGELVEYIQRVVPTPDVCNVWMDPRREPRAVAYFDEKIDLKEIRRVCRHDKFNTHSIRTDFVKPTWSVLVKTYQTNIFGVEDKLKYLFSNKKLGGGPVVKVEKVTDHNEDDTFQVSFHDGWNCVLEVIERDWYCDKQKLSVTPYFDCFREDFDEQLQRLKAEYRHSKSQMSSDDSVKVNVNSRKSSSAAVHKPNQPPLQQLAKATKSKAITGTAEQELGQDSNEDSTKCTSTQSHPRSSLATDKTETEAKQRTNENYVKLLLDHDITLLLLKYLKFDEAAKDLGVTVVFQDHENGIEISGPVKMRKDFQKMLTSVEDEMTFSECVLEFLAREPVQQEINRFIASSRCSVNIVTTSSKAEIEVNTGRKKETFQGFVTSLVVVKEIWLSSMKLSEQMEEFLKSINKPTCQIKVVDESLKLVYLACQPDQDETISAIHSKLRELMDSSQQPAHASEKTPRSNVNKSITLDCQNTVLPWMLNVLKFNETVKEEYDVDIEIDEEEDKIFITGQDEGVQSVKEIILKEDRKMTFQECVQEFIADEPVQRDIRRFLESSRCSVNVVTIQGRARIEVSTGKKKETLQDFVTSLVIVETVWSGPLENSAQLQDYIKYLECEKPRYHIRVDDKSIQLVYLASQPDKNDVVANVQNELKELMTNSQQFAHASEKTPMSKGMKKMTLDCQNTVLPWMLKALKFSESVKQEYGVDIEIDEEEDNIIISGQDGGVQIVKKIIQDEDNELHLTEDEKELFNLDEIRRRIHYSLKEGGLKCFLSCSSLKIVDESSRKMTIKEFLSKLVDVRTIPVPKEYLNSTQWKGMADILRKYKSYCLVGYRGSGINLMTVNSQHGDDTDKLTSLITKSRAEWKNSASPRDEADDSHDMGLDESGYCVVNFRRILHCEWQKQECWTLFLKSEIENIENWGKESAVTIVKTREGFEVISRSKDMSQSAHDHLQNILHKIVSRKHEFQFPGLVPFLYSEGREVLSNLQEAYRCFIDVPGPTSAGPVQLKKSAETLPGQKYDFVHLGTARTEDYKFHLIQEDLEKLKLSKTVLTLKFIPKAEPGEECGTSIEKSIFYISLPPWQHPDVEDYHKHFQKLRESFAEGVSLFITHAFYNNYSVVAVSTSELTQKPQGYYPFPAEVIAKTLVAQFCQKWQMLCIESSEARQDRRSLEVFVCEPNNENIFKSFKFFLKKECAYVGMPDQRCWDQVCHYGPEAIPKYSRLKRSRKVTIEVKQGNPYYNLSQGTLFCYPIPPSLEAATCPAIRDCIGVKRVESCVKHLLRNKPEGLMDGETFQLRGFRDNRNAIAYCCPDWGWDCGKAIQSIVEECLQSLNPSAAAPHEAIHFVPPGLHCNPRYPIGYLTQTFFKALDKFLYNNTRFENKSIILVVPDGTSAQAFDEELQKRYADEDTKEPEGWYNKLSSWWPFGNTGKPRTTGSRDKPATLQNDVPPITLTFWSLDKTSADEAADVLKNELQKLMIEEKLQLGKTETFSFLDKVENLHDFPVQISFREIYRKENTKPHHPPSNTKKNQKANGKSGNLRRKRNGGTRQQSDNQGNAEQDGQHVLTGSSLIINGLSEKYITQFKNMLRGLPCRGTDDQLPATNFNIESTCDKAHEDGVQEASDHESEDSSPSDMETSSDQEAAGQVKDPQDKRTPITSRMEDPTSQTSETDTAGSQFHNANESVALQASNDTCMEQSHAKTQPGQIRTTEASRGQIQNESEDSLDSDVSDPPRQFRWLYETISREGAIVYQYFEEAIGKQIEDGYTKQKSSEVKLKDAGVFVNVKFTSLYVTIKNNEHGIIRREKLQFKGQDEEAENSDFRLLELDTQSDDYYEVSCKLKDCLTSEKLKLHQIKRVENSTLFRRFRAKLSQMSIDRPQEMWCRVAKDVVQLISEYGFHPKFNFMHCDTAKRLGEGVIFCEKPEQCLQTLTSKEDVILVNALVLVGRTGKGKEGLRNPSADIKAPFDSVIQKTSGACMIFTDTQAYPLFVVTLRHK